LCAVVAVSRGERPVFAVRVFEQAAQVVALLRAVLADRWEPAAGAHMHGERPARETPGQSSRARAQHTTVRRRDEAAGGSWPVAGCWWWTICVTLGRSSVRGAVGAECCRDLDTTRATTPAGSRELDYAVVRAIDRLRRRGRVDSVGLAVAGFVGADRFPV